MRQIYTVHVNGSAWYHGVNAADALEHIITAQDAGEKNIQVQRNPWPKSTEKFDCCSGVDFHSSNCPVIRDGAVNMGQAQFHL
jgi:hypothetical protein